MNRNCHAFTDIFRMKIQELKTKQHECSSWSLGQERLCKAVLEKVIETFERQFAEVSFFSWDNGIDETKLMYTPITNLGTEGKLQSLEMEFWSVEGQRPLDVTDKRTSYPQIDFLVIHPSSDWVKKIVCDNGSGRQMRQKMPERLKSIPWLW